MKHYGLIKAWVVIIDVFYKGLAEHSENMYYFFLTNTSSYFW